MKSLKRDIQIFKIFPQKILIFFNIKYNVKQKWAVETVHRLKIRSWG